MSNWEIKKLGEITSWLSGGTPKKDEPAYWNGDIPWISANSMDGTRYNTSDLKITAEGLKNGSRLAPQDALLLLVRGGALHTKIPVGIARRPLAFNQDVKAIVAKPELIDPWFLLAWFMSKRDYLLNNIVEYTGIGAGKLDTVRLQKLKINLPPIKEQKALADIVNCLEEKIELNQRMNDTLEGIAQALFKSWFVDFDPVNAKAEGCKPEGMDDATAALFPSAFTESILGPIPEGWEISSLGNFIELAYGKALKANGRNEGFVPVYGSNGQIGWHDTALVKGPGIVVGRKGNPGTVIYVHEDFFSIDTTFFVIPSQRVPSIIFLYMLMERLGLPGLSADSAVPGLNRNAAYSARCILPPLNLIENFNKLITTFLLKKENLKNEN